ncbi:MAG: hypothetical protein LBQ98_00215 [Nitrososphaerota archaeon]|nr:hypothetical protein [Nitrososphaerota archaeon]
MIDEKDEDVKVDCGYVGDYRDEILRLFPGIRVHVCARVYRNKHLTEEEKVGNWFIARVRARVEYVFGYMTRFMAGITCRVHGWIVWVVRLLVRIWHTIYGGSCFLLVNWV